MSVYKLSKLSGVSQPGLKAIIKGKSAPSYDTILKISEGLGLTVAEFFMSDPSNDTDRLVALYNSANKQARETAFAVLRIGQPCKSKTRKNRRKES